MSVCAFLDVLLLSVSAFVFVVWWIINCAVTLNKNHLCDVVNFYSEVLFNSMGGRQIVYDCIIVCMCCCFNVQPLFVCPNAYHASVFVENLFMCLRECKSCCGLSAYTFPSPCHLFRHAGAGAWRRAPLPSSLRMPVVSSGVLQAQWQPTGTNKRGKRKTSNLWQQQR